MTPEQRRVVENIAAVQFSELEVGTDVDIATGEGFDEVPDGVFVRAWIKVPAEHIPGYVMETSPPSMVTVDYEQAFADGLVDVLKEKRGAQE